MSADMESWDDSKELPTKFNKYKRLKEREAAQAKRPTDGAVSELESSSVSRTSASPESRGSEEAQLTCHDGGLQGQSLQQGSYQQPSSWPNIDYMQHIPRVDFGNVEESMDCSLHGQNWDGSPSWSQKMNGSPRDPRGENFRTDERVCRSPRSQRSSNSPYHPRCDRSPLDHSPHGCTKSTRKAEAPLGRSLDRFPLAFNDGKDIWQHGLGSCPRLDNFPSTATIGVSQDMIRSRSGVCHCGRCAQCVANMEISLSRGCQEWSMDTSSDAPLDLRSRSSANATQSSRALTVQRTVVTSESSLSNVIDEHFKRSLGVKYSQLVKYPSAPSSAPPSAPSHASNAVNSGTASSLVSVTGSVDDHFSKSLGDHVWRQMKDTSSTGNRVARKEVASPPGSVDDHFIKALGGETWQRIKADQEQAAERSTSVPPCTATRYYPVN